MTLNFAFASHNKESNRDRTIIDMNDINSMTLMCEVIIVSEMMNDNGVIIDEDEASIMIDDDDAFVLASNI